MKKKLILFSVLLFSSFQIFAQAQKARKQTFASHISLGPVVSLGHSWVSDAGTDLKYKFAPAAGIGLVYSKNVHWGFGAQLLVSHEGFRYEYATPVGTGYRTVNPVYLRMPLHGIYFFGDYGDRVRPKIYAGPSVAFKVDERHFYSDDLLKPVEGSAAAADVYRSFDAGLSAGAGANVRLNRATWLNLDLGYYHGLTNAVEGYSMSNRNLRLNVGLMWGL